MVETVWEGVTGMTKAGSTVGRSDSSPINL